MKNEVHIDDRDIAALLAATNSHLGLEADFVEKSVNISELLTELGIQLNQIKVQKNEMDRVKLDHITVVGKFKECDGEFKKLDVLFYELEISYIYSLMLQEESSMACRIMKLVQKPRENNKQQYVELHEYVTSLPEVSSTRSDEHSIEMSKIYVTESPNVLSTSLNGFVLKQEDLLGELMKMKNAINDTLTAIKAKAIDYGPGPSDSSASEENRIQKNLKEKISILQQVEILVNDLKGDRYVLEEKYYLLKDLNASINASKAKRNKYKGQVHGMQIFLDQMKDALAREMQISQSKSMELDAFREE